MFTIQHVDCKLMYKHHINDAMTDSVQSYVLDLLASYATLWVSQAVYVNATNNKLEPTLNASCNKCEYAKERSPPDLYSSICWISSIPPSSIQVDTALLL